MIIHILCACIALSLAISGNAFAQENQGHIGIGTYSLSITDQSFTDTFTGSALILGYDFSQNIALDSHLYALKYELSDLIEMNGYDIVARFGKVGTGFNISATAGLWSETLSSPLSTTNADYSGTSLGFTIGYGWRDLLISLEGTRRTVADYQGNASGNYDAATGAFNVLYRF